MAATNKTPNYDLPQWVASDPVEMADFNQAMSDIDTNLNLVQVELMPASGSNANGSYTKFPDGTLICNKIVTASGVAVTNTWGNLFIGNISLGNFALAFVGNIPAVTAVNTSSAAAMVVKVENISLSYAGIVTLARGTSATDTFTINVQAIGRWK